MSTPITTFKLLIRETLLNANSELIEQLQKRLKAKHFRAQEGDRLKLATSEFLFRHYRSKMRY